jgi:hypothetical protein
MLSANDNLFNTCLRILRHRGFALSVAGDGGDADHYPEHLVWTAHSPAFAFRAENPIALLGLVAIHDHLRPADERKHWWHLDGPDIRAELLAEAFDRDA